MAPHGPVVAVICKLQISIRNRYLIIHPFLALLFQRFISTTLESKETEFYHISKSRKPSIAFICCRPTRNSRQCLLIAWLPTSTKRCVDQTPSVTDSSCAGELRSTPATATRRIDTQYLRHLSTYRYRSPPYWSPLRCNSIHARFNTSEYTGRQRFFPVTTAGS